MPHGSARPERFSIVGSLPVRQSGEPDPEKLCHRLYAGAWLNPKDFPTGGSLGASR